MKVDVKLIYLAMADKNYNGIDLARAADVSPQSVSQILNGTRRGTTKVLGNICKALDISVRDVITVED